MCMNAIKYQKYDHSNAINIPTSASKQYEYSHEYLTKLFQPQQAFNLKNNFHNSRIFQNPYILINK
jgi:hypothetical protein